MMIGGQMHAFCLKCGEVKPHLVGLPPARRGDCSEMPVKRRRKA